jgi:hypothetical protein
MERLGLDWLNDHPALAAMEQERLDELEDEMETRRLRSGGDGWPS